MAPLQHLEPNPWSRRHICSSINSSFWSMCFRREGVSLCGRKMIISLNLLSKYAAAFSSFPYLSPPPSPLLPPKMFSLSQVLREVMTIGEKDQPSPVLDYNIRGGVEGELCPYPADPTFDEVGYKVLLYLTRCFRGRVLGGAEPLPPVETGKVSTRTIREGMG